MRFDAVLELAKTDLALHRRSAVFYALAAVVGVALAAADHPVAQSLGVSLILCVGIGQCFHLPIVTVFHDIVRGSRAFVLSLPVTPAEYAAGKLAASATLFLVPAVAVVLAALLAPPEQRVFSLPLLLLFVLGWLVFFVQNLGLALVSESTGVTMTALMAEIFVFGNGSMILLPRIPGALGLWSDLEAGGPALFIGFALFTLELGVIVALILTCMSRKRRFV